MQMFRLTVQITKLLLCSKLKFYKSINTDPINTFNFWYGISPDEFTGVPCDMYQWSCTEQLYKFWSNSRSNELMKQSEELYKHKLSSEGDEFTGVPGDTPKRLQARNNYMYISFNQLSSGSNGLAK